MVLFVVAGVENAASHMPHQHSASEPHPASSLNTLPQWWFCASDDPSDGPLGVGLLSFAHTSLIQIFLCVSLGGGGGSFGDFSQPAVIILSHPYVSQSGPDLCKTKTMNLVFCD